MSMSPSKLSLVAASLALLLPLATCRPSNVNHRRDETPKYPYDPDTTSYCTWWIDNDGSTRCRDVPALWGISLDDFRRWNPLITASCTGFEVGMSYCVEAYGEPAPSSTTATTTTTSTTTTTTTSSTSISTQSTTATVTTTTTTATTTSSGNGIATPTPTQPGMTTNCNKFYKVQENDGCEAIAQANGITLSDFYTWNSQVGTDCSVLWTDYYVCVAVIGGSSSSSSSTATATTTIAPSTTTSNGISTPTPTQPGMVSNCNKFYKVTDADGCASIVQSNGISLAQFYTWNTQVGSDCSTLWTDYYVCVGVTGGVTSTTTTTTTSTTTSSSGGLTTPTPIQPGMVTTCDAFYYVSSDEVTCANIAAENGISLAQFYTWNPTVGTDCGSLWTDYYVCVSIIGVSSSATTTTKPTTTTTTTGNGVATPTPIEPGMTTSCKAFHKVVKSDECGVIATNAGISLANFLKWNPGVGSGCEDLWLDYYVCVAVL